MHAESGEIEKIYKDESRRVLATLVRLLGDFDLAEDALHDAFAAALDRWPKEGIPGNPKAWLVSAGRFRAIDALRKKARANVNLDSVAEQGFEDNYEIEEGVADDQLRMIFTCCHPALAHDARVALTLREVCGLTTEEIARAFLSPVPTVAQRIVRAKAKIRDAGIPYEVPSPVDLPQRLETVLQVIYLVFNEGYSASSGSSVTRADLSGEAIRLGRLLGGLMESPEIDGLLALMLIQESRRAARSAADGSLILLEFQDRSKWNRDQIREGENLIAKSFASGGFGPYSIQAAIGSVHAQAQSPEETDWNEIVGLYDLLLQFTPSPVIELNRAVAVAMRDGPEAGLNIIDAIFERGDLADYYLAHSAKAEFCRRLGRNSEAQSSYERALTFTMQEPEKRFLESRINELRLK